MVYKSLINRALGLALALTTGGLVAAQVVPTLSVKRSPATTTFEIDGRIESQHQSTVAAQVAGTLREVTVQAGDRVTAGQMLARIDERETRAGLNSAEAAIAQAAAQLDEAQTTAERTRELHDTGFTSRSALDSAQTRLRSARAALKQALAGRAQAALAFGNAIATAPFDATVLATLVEAGDLASPGLPLMILYEPNSLRAVVQVPASRSARARTAVVVEVRLPGGLWIGAVDRTELPSADPVSQTIEWRLDLAETDSTSLAPGQAVRVRFSGGAPAGAAPTRAVVPASALLRRGELTAVYVAADNRFVLRAVRIGPAAGQDGIEIVAGLQPGERIAADPVRAGLDGAQPALDP